MADSDLIKLYSAKILELASSIPLTDRLPSPDASVTQRSPQCGSTITVDVEVTDGRVTGFGQDVKACALGQAAASLTARSIVGRTREEVVEARDALRAMLTEDGSPPEAPFEGFEVLTPAREFRNRHASIMLSLDASVEALTALQDKSVQA